MQKFLAAVLSVLSVFSFADTFVPIGTQGKWTLENPEMASLSDRDGLEVTLKKESANKKFRIMLKQPAAVNNADTLQFFFCMPFIYGPDYAHNINVLLKDSAGKELNLRAGATLNTHFAPGNSRKTAYWMFAEVDLKQKKAAEFTGLEIEYLHWNKASEPKESRLYLRDMALTKIDYGKSKLYYAASNFRGNFNNPAFNGCEGRFLTDVTGGTAYPFLFLDNAVDHVKFKRPERLDLRFDMFDEKDRRIWSAEHKGIPAKNAYDSARKFEIPVTRPGTYRVRIKSYDAGTGTFFTQEWMRFIILRGSGKLPAAPLPERLAINPETPWGVLKDNQKLIFRIQGLDDAKWELKWGFMPFTTAPVSFSAEQKYTLKETVPLNSKSMTVQRPFSTSGEDLVTVTAELWRNGVRVERVDRDMGIGNTLPRSPETGTGIPAMADAFRENGGIWQNLQLHAFDGINDKQQWFEKNIGELKKISPWLGFNIYPGEFEPLPGVFNWKPLERLLDIAARHQARVVLYLAEKYPPEWAPVRFFLDENGKAHNSHIVWKYLKGGYNYATGEGAPEIIRNFNIQLARRFKNHPGLGAYYFENEHIVSDGSSPALAASHDAGNRKCFQAFLKKKYETPASLNRAYGTKYRSFAEVPFPTAGRKHNETNLMKLDFQEYIWDSAGEFIRNYQLDPVRREDPSRPIVVYAPAMLRTVKAEFYEHMVKNDALLANGGVHSWLDQMIFREAHNAVPGLLERMEPHNMFSYAPGKYGLDDMIFGMLAMGGRGLNFHYFYWAKSWEAFQYEKYLNEKNPCANGFRILKDHFPAILELSKTEVFHDPVGIMDLPSADFHTYLPQAANIRNLMAGLHVVNHYKPKVRTAGGRTAYLDDVKIIFVSGNLITQEEMNYLKRFIENGGVAVLEHNAAAFDFSAPDSGENVFLKKLNAQKLPAALQSEQSEAFSLGKGRILRLKTPVDWRKKDLIPSIMKYAGIKSRIYDSGDACMQVNPLRRGGTFYFAVAHRGGDGRSGINGPRSAKNVRLRLFGFDPQQKYALQDIWNPSGKEELLSGRQLKEGFNAGDFEEEQMKVFRVRPAE